MFFQDDDGHFYRPDQAARTPGAKPTWRCLQPPIVYLPHELSPMLYVLDDRVVEVVGMANKTPSYLYKDLNYPDTQVALMRTETDIVMRMAVGFSTPDMPRADGGCHWRHIKGTEGILESPRAPGQDYLLWVQNWQLKEPLHIPWTHARTDGPREASQSGHGGTDYFTFAHFADAVLYGEPLVFDVYKAAETAAPAILAATSMEQGSKPLKVPDFRPGPHRKPGQMPK